MTLAAAEREIIRREGFYAFARLAWPYINSGKFVDGWHIAKVCERAEASLSPAAKDLVVNMPPGMSKSTLLCVLLPAYAWTVEPTFRVATTSYDPKLALRDAAKTLTLLRSRWFIDRWGDIVAAKRPAVGFFYTRAGGYRVSTGTKGAVTGKHFDLFIVDDPVKPQDILGGPTVDRAALEASIDWWRLTVTTRLEGAVRRKIVVMQRLHERDLSGWCLEQEGEYEHLRLPMRAEDDPTDPRAAGALLAPERYPEHVVRAMEQNLGPMGTAAQFQQRPAPREGALFRTFRYWHPEGHGECRCGHELDGVYRFDAERDAIDTGCLSWDLTFKDKQTSDFVAGSAWGTRGPLFLLLDAFRQRLSFRETLDVMRAFALRWPQLAHDILVEDAANGAAVEDTLRSELSPSLKSAAGGVLVRAQAVEGLFEAERVLVPHPSIAPWVVRWKREHMSFPVAPHDDEVAASTQALLHLRSSTRFLAAMRASMTQRTR